MYCKNCGKKLDEQVLFCPNCGTKITENNDYVNQNTSEKENLYLKAATFGNIIGAFLMIVGVFLPAYKISFLELEMSISYYKGDGWFLILLAGISVVLLLLDQKLFEMFPAGIAFWMLANLFIQITKEEIQIGSFGIGFYLMYLGEILLCATTIFLFVKEKDKTMLPIFSPKVKICIMVTTAGIVVLSGAYKLEPVIQKALSYHQAEASLKKGDYLDALQKFDELGDYRDSETKIKECHYQYGKVLLNNNDYETARKAFSFAGDEFEDIDKLRQECDFLEAESYMEEENYEYALELYETLDFITDIDVKIKECHYQMALEYMDDNLKDNALVEFQCITGYKDSDQYIEELSFSIEDYIGVWIDTGYEFNVIEIGKENSQFYVHIQNEYSMMRIAETQVYFDMGDIADKTLTLPYDSDGWGHYGTIYIQFMEDSLKVNITSINGADWYGEDFSIACSNRIYTHSSNVIQRDYRMNNESASVFRVVDSTNTYMVELPLYWKESCYVQEQNGSTRFHSKRNYELGADGLLFSISLVEDDDYLYWDYVFLGNVILDNGYSYHLILSYPIDARYDDSDALATQEFFSMLDDSVREILLNNITVLR